MPPPVDSLRGRLTRLVLWPALLLVAASAVADYLNAATFARDAQDNLLLKTAVALATRLAPDENDESQEAIRQHLDTDDEATLRADRLDVIDFLVLDGQGQWLAGNLALRPLLALDAQAPPDLPRQADAIFQTQPVRLVELRHTARGYRNQVLVTSTLRKRREDTQRMFFSSLWPTLLLLTLMLVLMRGGIARALQPLTRLGEAIDRRAPEDLQPIPLARRLGEVQPLITAVNRLLERQRQASDEQQLFLSSAAHQLRTPLAGVLTQLEMAALDAPPEQRPRLHRVQGAVRQLAHCTQQMLTLARASEQASGAQHFAPLQLPDLLEEAASRWLDPALARGQTLHFEPAPASCVGSPWMLQEALHNLIDNAIRHGPPGTPITVRCGSDTLGAPYLEVEDEGPGIPMAERERVCRPYVRGAATTATGAGAGLGLAVVAEVAARHHGRLRLRDRTVGSGLRVRLEFPAPGAASDGKG